MLAGPRPFRLHVVATACSGVTAIEYALIAGLICLVIVAAVQGLGSAVLELFTSVAAAL